MTTEFTTEELDRVFGSDSTGTDPETRARSSSRLFVRSIDQLAEFAGGATGRRLKASEALHAYGFSKLIEVATEGAALLCDNPTAAGLALKRRRESLGLSLQDVAHQLRISEKVLEKAERSVRAVGIDLYETIAQHLGMDERYISVRLTPPTDDQLAVRLRSYQNLSVSLSQRTILTLAESAWVAATQTRLERELGLLPDLPAIERSTNYGSPGYPAYQHGYYLAQKTRSIFKLGTARLPMALREFCEERLGIPVIYAALGAKIAGATLHIDTGHDAPLRALVLNSEGGNEAVLVRRSTIAHELGHLIWDPSEKMQSVRVDNYEDLERDPQLATDYVEQRANAFGVEFIAPQAAVVGTYQDGGIEEVVREYGLGPTAARYHIWNALGRQTSLEGIGLLQPAPNMDDFAAVERFTLDYHPFQGLPDQLAGRFSGVVVLAATNGLISWETARQYLGIDRKIIENRADDVVRLFFPQLATPMVTQSVPPTTAASGAE